MKKRILSVILAAMLTVMTSVPAFATPTSEVEVNQQRYDELQGKVNEIDNKIRELNVEIDPLVDKIATNKQEMKNIEQQIDNSKLEIENAKVDIEKQEDVLDERVRELYKSGGSSSYLMILFSANSVSDLFSKMDATNRIVEMDKKVVTELEKKQDQLADNIKSLETKSKDIAKINDETQKVLSEFQVKADEQKKLADEAKSERAAFEGEFLIPSERQLVANDISLVSSSDDISTINSAISRLKNIKNQLKSDTVKNEVTNAINKGNSRIKELEIQNLPNRGEASGTGQGIVDYAYKFLGTPYVYGGTTPSGFDCSGFTSYVYRHAAGIEISRTTHTQRYQGRSIPYNQMQVGDLVFTSGYGHVGIYVGGGNFIHAPQTGDVVKVSKIFNFVEARRIL